MDHNTNSIPKKIYQTWKTKKYGFQIFYVQ